MTAAADTGGPPAPPQPAIRPVKLVAHGDERIDDYAWMRDRDDPEVITHLEAENSYTAASTAHLAGLRDRLYEEIVARIQETDLSVPSRRGPWWYYSRTVEGLQYAIHCRKAAEPGEVVGLAERPVTADDLPSKEVVTLDENAEAEGHDFFALGVYSVSPDHRVLAWASNHDGSERFTLRFRDLHTGEDLADVVENVYYGLAWTGDSGTVFYTRPDEAMRPYQLWRHRLGTAASDDECVLTESDDRFFLEVGTTKDRLYVTCTIASKLTTEVHVLPAAEPGGELRVVEPRRQGVEYTLEHQGGRFLIVTNDDGASNFKLMEAPTGSPGRARWREVIGHRPDVKLDGIDVFSAHVVLFERAGGLERIRVMDPASGTATALDFPEPVYSAWGGANHDYDDHVLRFGYTSLVTPQSVFDHDMRTGGRRLLKQQPVLGGYDPSAYETERLWATAGDGTRIPMSVVYPRGTPRDGSAPALLYGYGAYEISVDPAFSSLRLSLLERGFVFAIAHVRGGGEMGRAWYEDGKLLHKRNTFTDFVACAHHLFDEGFTSPSRLAIRGGSAGGLLMGAVTNEAAELFAAVVAQVPFVDCLTTMQDASLPLTVTEWEEWGNPVDDPEVYAYMKGYSPYDNVSEQSYPAILATSGLNDPRVGFWEPAKWVAKLRRQATGDAPILLKTELGAGHHGPSGRYDAWKDEAFVLAFVLDQLDAVG